LSGNLSDVNHFETLCGDSFIALDATDAEGRTLSIDGNVMNNTSGLMSVDLVTRIACDSYFSNISSISVNVLSTDDDIQDLIEEAVENNTEVTGLTSYNNFKYETDAIEMIPKVA